VIGTTRHGFARYHAVFAVWIPLVKLPIRDRMAAWGKRPPTTRAFLYAEIATRKMRTLTIDWEGLISNGGTNWIWQAL
jgi:hypothetical protein